MAEVDDWKPVDTKSSANDDWQPVKTEQPKGLGIKGKGMFPGLSAIANSGLGKAIGGDLQNLNEGLGSIERYPGQLLYGEKRLNRDEANQMALDTVMTVGAPPLVKGAAMSVPAAELLGKIPQVAKSAGGFAEKGMTGLLHGLGATERPFVKAPDPIARSKLKAVDLAQTALKESGIDAKEIARKLREAKARGRPMTALDVAVEDENGMITKGHNILGLASAAARMPGKGAEIAGTYLKRMGQAGNRVKTEFDKLLSGSKFYMNKDTFEQRMKNAGTAYDRAYEGGSMAPLEKQFENTFSELSSQLADAQKRAAAADQKITNAIAKRVRTSNVYAHNSSLAEESAAEKELSDAQARVADLQKQKSESIGLLKQAQNDRSQGTKGAVWSPRINQFLKDPDFQVGLRRGWKEEKDMALAENRPIKASEYAITGEDKEGNPIVSQVPNMRRLDLAKRGLDRMIEEGMKTGQNVRPLIAKKNAFIRAIDEINPDWKVARKEYADPARLKEALLKGREEFPKMDAEQIKEFMDDPDIPKMEKMSAAVGFGRYIDGLLKSPARSSNPAAIWRDENLRDRIAAVAGNDIKTKEDFFRFMDEERAMARNSQIIHGGSPTMKLQENAAAIKSAPSGVLQKVVGAVTNPHGEAMRSGMEYLSDTMKKRMDKFNSDTAAELMQLFTSDDPEVWENIGKNQNGQK